MANMLRNTHDYDVGSMSRLIVCATLTVSLHSSLVWIETPPRASQDDGAGVPDCCCWSFIVDPTFSELKAGKNRGHGGSEWEAEYLGRLVVRAAKEGGVDVKQTGASGDILPSGDWPENFSLLNYEDRTKHYEPDLFKPEAQADKILAEVMSKIMLIAFPE